MSRHVRLLGAGLLAAALLTATPSRAAVTIKQSMTMTGLGGIMDSETKMVTRIKGDMKSDDTEMKMTNKMMKFLGGGKPIHTTTIYRLDREPAVAINVDHQSKTATETPLTDMRAMLDSAAAMWGGGQKSAPGSGPSYDTSKVTFSPPKIDVKKTGATATIGGYPCQQTIVTVEVEGTDNETGNKFKLITVMDMYLAANIPGAEEQDAFNQKLAAIMGFTPENSQSSMKGMMGMMKAYGMDPDDLEDAAGKLDGYPMKSVITFRGEGDQFAMGSTESGDDSGEASGSSDEDGGDASANAAAAKVLGGLFGKKKDKGNDDKASEPTGPPSIFTATLVVDEISTGAIGDESFSAPEKYKYITGGDE